MNKDEVKWQIQKYIEEGLIEKAGETIQQYKKNMEYDDEMASMEAIINLYTGDLDQALNCIKSGLEVNIFNGDLYFTMGNVYEMKQEYNRACLCYEHALTYINKEENVKVMLDAINNLKVNYNIEVRNYSIVILTYNNLDYTKVCIDSIRKYNSNDNCEIIIIDNKSTDGTVEWIKQQNGIKYILNDENKGFPGGCNQGIEISEKNNDIFLLNNDTVIMPNSIFNLRMGLYSNENIGSTGAVSNSVTYYQQIREIYDDFDGYMKFALKNNITSEESYEERIKLVGFAMFIKRNVLDEVGYLDERFTPGNYEDDDISLRITNGGYKLLLCKDSYIHHFGSVSFRMDELKYNSLLMNNSKKFREKWGFRSEKFTDIKYEFISLIESNKNKSENILHVGCGCGATLLAIKNKYPNSKLYGIEVDINAAQIASSYAEVLSINIENDNLNYEEEYFDYILISDVLEKFYDPQKVMENIKKYLKPDGYILINVLNINHHSVIDQLINGMWTYDDLGIINKANIRFFTKSEIITILNNLGFKDIVFASLQRYISNEDNVFIEKLSSLSRISVTDELKSYQYIFKAKKNNSKKQLITKKCGFLFRRLEFDIDIEEAITEIIKYLKEGIIDEDIILDAVAKYVVDKVLVLNFIAIKCLEHEISNIVIPLLNNAYQIAPQDLDTNYNLAYVLNMIGQKALAIEYLNKLDGTNENIDQLKIMIGGAIDE